MPMPARKEKKRAAISDHHKRDTSSSVLTDFGHRHLHERPHTPCRRRLLLRRRVVLKSLQKPVQGFLRDLAPSSLQLGEAGQPEGSVQTMIRRIEGPSHRRRVGGGRRRHLLMLHLLLRLELLLLLMLLLLGVLLLVLVLRVLAHDELLLEGHDEDGVLRRTCCSPAQVLLCSFCCSRAFSATLLCSALLSFRSLPPPSAGATLMQGGQRGGGACVHFINDVAVPPRTWYDLL